MNDLGNIVITNNPFCARCKERIRDNDTIYYCSEFKIIFCYKCEVENKQRLCRSMEVEHIHYYSLLTIKENADTDTTD